jgi:hypothetical protein
MTTHRDKPKRPEPPPPGATRRASDHDLRPGEPASPAGDPEAAGTPGGGSEVGGLAGTNVGDGAPENADLEEAMGRGIEPEAEDEDGAYGGPHGGAVGGTPAGGRASGGHPGRGYDPGGERPVDSTLGADPKTRRSGKRRKG